MQYSLLFRQLRERKGLTAEALAKLARCHRNTVLNVERGRPVRFATLAALTTKMGYPSDSAEMASLALLWLEAVSGIDLADPATLNSTRRKTASYTRGPREAATALLDEIRRVGLNERQIRLLAFAAGNPEILGILETVQNLLTSRSAADDLPDLKVAEDN